MGLVWLWLVVAFGMTQIGGRVLTGLGKGRLEREREKGDERGEGKDRGIVVGGVGEDEGVRAGELGGPVRGRRVLETAEEKVGVEDE